MPVLLAKVYDPEKHNPTGYFVSEKLDGLRAVWNGKNLVSRNDNVFPSPPWFTEGFPKNIPLDGELWLRRGALEETSSIVRSGKDKGWQHLKYLLFDIPEPRAGLVEARWDGLQKLVKHIGKDYVQYVPQTLCTGKEQLEQLHELVIKQGGEGLMLRKPKSLYEAKRSSTLLKVKKYYDDEAIVAGYEESEIETLGKAHLIGSMGALICDWKGHKIKVGTGFTDDDRLHPPKIGTRITFRYLKITDKGVPYAPVYAGVRHDE